MVKPRPPRDKTYDTVHLTAAVCERLMNGGWKLQFPNVGN